MRVALALALASAACVSSQVAPAAGRAFRLEDEERGLWSLSSEAQEQIDRSGRVLADADLEAYLAGVARRLEPAEVFEAVPFRVRVLRDPEPNAFCLPNGAVYLQTGMLARMESEAELAVLLAHEMTHAVGRHALRELRTAESSGTWLNVLGALGGGTGSGGLMHLAAVSGYSRDLEREADREGMARAAAAGYDLAAAPVLYRRLLAWSAAEGGKQRPAFYASHPRLQERIESSQKLAEAPGAPRAGARDAEAYQARTALALIENARLELSAGHLDFAREQAERFLALRPRDAAGHLALGEVARRDSGPGSAAAAAASYRRALELDPGVARAWRGLGLVLWKTGERAEARRAFARYLELAPDAPDRAHVRTYLDEPPGGKP